MWIESLKTLMNDNKTLTFASNKRIAAAPQIKLGNSQPLTGVAMQTLQLRSSRASPQKKKFALRLKESQL